MIIEIIAILFLLLLSAFFSSSETAITRISDAKVLQWDSKHKKAKSSLLYGLPSLDLKQKVTSGDYLVITFLKNAT